MGMNKEELAQTCRMIAYFGWDEVSFGHCSLRLSIDHFLINQEAKDFATLSANQIMAINGQGEPLEQGQPASFKLHRVFHAASARNNVVLHSHHPQCVAMANIGYLTYSSQYEAMLGQPAFIFKDVFTGFKPEKIAEVRPLLESAEIVFCERHGVFVFGEDLQTAFFRLYLACRAADIVALRGPAPQAYPAFQVPWPSRAQIEGFWMSVGRRADDGWKHEVRKAS